MTTALRDASTTPRPTLPSGLEEPADLLRRRIADGTAVVAVVGLGYVGVPLMRAFWDDGLPVRGYDVDADRVERLRRGESPLKHLGAGMVAEMAAGDPERFTVSTDLAGLAEADAVLICVPTPLGKHHDPDLSYVERAADAVARTLRPGQLVVLESTTYPHTTRDVVLPRLAASGLACGIEFFLAYSPEREDPGRRDHSTATIPKLVGGVDPISGELATSLYRRAVHEVIPVSSAAVAEAAKILENVYRGVNIALVNEMKRVLDALGIDVWEVIEAAATKPFGFQPFYPGPGMGGHCIPIDPFYLAWKAREVGEPTRFIELAGEVNRAMPDYVVGRLTEALNRRGKAVGGSRILVLGLAYKPDVDDIRESPSLELLDRLEELGAVVDYNDPHVPCLSPRAPGGAARASVPLSSRELSEYDCVVVATNHSVYDWQRIAESSRLVVDTRNALARVTGDRGHIVKA